MFIGIYDTGLAHTQQAARISAERKLLIGTIVDAGQKLQVSGTALITGAATFNSSVTANNLVIKNVGVPAAQFYRDLDVSIVGTAGQGIEFGARNGATFIAAASIYGGLETGATTGNLVFQTLTSGSLTTKLTITSAGNLLIGTTTDSGQKLQVSGGTLIDGAALSIKTNNTSGYTSLANFLNNVRCWQIDNVSNGFSIYVDGTANNYIFNIKSTGVINLKNVPTSSAGLVSGDIYQTAGVLNIVP